MSEADKPTPATTIATGDPGDETLRRYRYQWTFAADLCVMLLDELGDAAEIFCEQHEDILVKLKNGMFVGIQIKTRQSDQDPWKANEETVINACAKFAGLEKQFPGQFQRFRFLTNHPLYAAGNSNDFRHVLAEVGRADSFDTLTGRYRSFVLKVASEAACDNDTTFAALKKARANDDLPKLRDVEMRLLNDLVNVWDKAADLPIGQIRRAARHLANECQRASSLAHQDVLPAYIAAGADPEGEELRHRLEGKRFDEARVLEILDTGFSATSTLAADPSELIEPGGGEHDLLAKKLDAGGFGAVSLNSAADLRDKADFLALTWVQKLGRQAGLQRYQHVRSIVLRDAADAYEATKDEGDNFGVAMLSDLRSRLKERRNNGTPLYDCSLEHLEGYAYSLTSECQVQWSIARPWDKD